MNQPKPLPSPATALPSDSQAQQTVQAEDKSTAGANFIAGIIADDLAAGRVQQVVTRFPPEPNGYLHLGHVKSICLNFGMADQYGGVCHLRMDDTNPEAETPEFVENIQRDVQWLGFEWDGATRYASSYFQQLYDWAIQLIQQGDAYVDLQTPEQIRENRGNFRQAGTPSPQRDASVEENLARFAQMKAGEFAPGAAVLRAKIDMASRNMNMRDPVLYRVLKAHHHQTGDAWNIYPMYDYAHPLSDAIEGISHSLCTLEFEDHRAFYDWVIEKVGFAKPPRQYEFARLNVDYTLTSKRKLKRLVDEKIVSGWDDPRLPTVAGMRRRGFTPAGLRDFCQRVGVSKADGVVDVGLLEFCIRQSLDPVVPRAMAVLEPLQVTLTNLPADLSVTQPRHPHHEAMGTRELTLTRQIFIERSDFELAPPKGFKRLSPGAEVRLRGTYVIRCDEVQTDEQGQVTGLLCSIDPETLGRNPEGRKVKGVIHWVSAEQGLPAEVRLYAPLFQTADPEAVPPDQADNANAFLQNLNPDSLQCRQAILEPSLRDAVPGDRFQFERQGYFVVDTDSTPERLIFNRILDLKDSYKPS